MLFRDFAKIFAPQAICLAHAQFCFFCLQLRACEAENPKIHLAILCLIVLRSNLQISASNFTCRDTHLENVKFDLNSRRFAQAKLCRHLKKRRRGRGATSRLLAVASMAKQNSSPHPLYNKVKNNLKRLFFTQGNQTRNVKFDKTKFGIVNLRGLGR